MPKSNATRWSLEQASPRASYLPHHNLLYIQAWAYIHILHALNIFLRMTVRYHSRFGKTVYADLSQYVGKKKRIFHSNRYRAILLLFLF